MKTTKELARELGLLRRRTIAGSRDMKSNDKLCDQSFKYLIVIDFESTCWKEGKFRTQEIIEFPAVLLNTVSGEIESEFHFYVQPQEQPVLSSFCTELTGITQDRVDNGIPINLCLRKFRYWLEKLHTDKGVLCTGTTIAKGKQETSICNTTCVTWSDWDLGVCLQYECKRKQLLKPPELTSWIDLRATYRKFYQRKPNGLNGALQDLGINFEGREHSGVDDARNTAKLAHRLIQDGCHLKVTKSLKNHERSTSCNPSIDLYFKPNSVSLTNKQTTSEPKLVNPHKSHTKPPGVSNCRSTPSKIPQLISKAEPYKHNDSAEKGKALQKSDLVSKCDNRDFKNVTPIKVSNAHDTGSCKIITPVKISGKRKEVTPLKTTHSDGAVSSPCRKAARKFTPKKISGKDIFVDSTPSNIIVAKQGKKSNNKPGLNEHKANIPVANKETGMLTNTKKAIVPNTQTSKSVFKKPGFVANPRGTSYLPQATKENIKSFCASTPVGNSAAPKSLINRDLISPILPTNTSTGILTAANRLVKTNTSHNFKTPSTIGKTSAIGHQFKTSMSSSSASCQSTFLDGSIGNSSSSSMKMTPPLCKCGRRSKRRMVQSPGQNMGRFFFSCSVRKGSWSKEGCDFFKWEVTGNTLKGSSISSRSGSRTSGQFTPVLKTNTPNYTNRGNLGVRTAFKTPMCIH